MDAHSVLLVIKLQNNTKILNIDLDRWALTRLADGLTLYLLCKEVNVEIERFRKKREGEKENPRQEKKIDPWKHVVPKFIRTRAYSYKSEL